MKQGLYNLSSLGTIAIALVVAVIILSFGASIVSDMQTDLNDSGGAAGNVTVKGLESISTLAKWVPTIALILAAAIVIGIIVTSFRV